jgi:hypothetical protein
LIGRTSEVKQIYTNYTRKPGVKISFKKLDLHIPLLISRIQRKNLHIYALVPVSHPWQGVLDTEFVRDRLVVFLLIFQFPPVLKLTAIILLKYC